MSGPLHRIVSVSVCRMTETCERTTFFVNLTTDEGFSTTPVSHRTGSVHKGPDGERIVTPGLAIEEARRRAVLDADDWGDLLGIEVEPFVDEDGTHKPDRPMRRFTTRRILAERRAATDRAADRNDDHE